MTGPKIPLALHRLHVIEHNMSEDVDGRGLYDKTTKQSHKNKKLRFFDEVAKEWLERSRRLAAHDFEMCSGAPGSDKTNRRITPNMFEKLAII